MRMLLLLRLVLAAAGALLASADSSSNSIKMMTTKERDKVVNNLEANLLSLLGFKKRPKPMKPAYVPESLKQLYARQNTIDTTDIAKPGIHVRSSNTVRTFSHVESATDDNFRSPHRFRLVFDVSSVPSTEVLHAAQLSLTRISLEDSKKRPGKSELVRILVHDILQPGVKSRQKKPILRLIDSKVLDISNNGSISLDVEPAMQRWLAEGANHGLLIQVVGWKDKAQEKAHVRLRRGAEDRASWSLNQPVLYAYTDDGKNKMADAGQIMDKRAKRAALYRSRKRDGRGNCRRHPLYVDFADVGWTDWIVAPPGYDAFYCHGDCPFPLADHLNSTNHAIVQNLVHSINPSSVPKACCVPTALSSTSMLYLDEENKVVMKNYQDMTVVGCGCR